MYQKLLNSTGQYIFMTAANTGTILRKRFNNSKGVNNFPLNCNSIALMCLGCFQFDFS